MAENRKETASYRLQFEPDLPQAGAVSVKSDPEKSELVTFLPRPQWVRARVKASSGQANEVEKVLHKHSLITVCDKAHCPNISECSGRGVATFMILGDKCTRNCRFCAVESGQPAPPDEAEPEKLAEAAVLLGLDYVVITSVTRDDLADGGALHFVRCIRAIRQHSPEAQIEILVPDFKGIQTRALDILGEALPDTLNHNLETVPRLYSQARSGADYVRSLGLLGDFKKRYPNVRTRSGLMAGLGETDEEILQVMQDLRDAGVDMLTIGQYLRPSPGHLPVLRYVHPDTFGFFEKKALQMGFAHAACAPLVRSSYKADSFLSALSVKSGSSSLD